MRSRGVRENCGGVDAGGVGGGVGEIWRRGGGRPSCKVQRVLYSHAPC